ncbi:AAA family ATPase [Candidatus Micrarchaeota archaeon]|nr:AAA family ATPase [Candidatus Micrarchaeota archaeon]
MKNEDRVTTGVQGIDSLVGGGYIKNSVISLSGGPGSGKTTFALQFLLQGIKEDENVMYISFNLKKKEIFQHINQLNLGLDMDVIKNRMLVIEYPPGEIQELLKRHGAIREMIDTANVTRVVIDPITSFVYIQPDVHQRREYLYSIVDNLKNWNVTSLIIDHDSKYELLEIPQTLTGIEGFTDGYIHLSYLLNIEKMERNRGLEILKMRGAQDDTKVHKIFITEQGIVVDDVSLKRAKPRK